MGPICGYCKRCQKTSGYYGDYMWVLRRMENVDDYLCPICGYCKECKMLAVIMGLICGYCKECKRSALIMGLICKYCILENGLMEFIIENDVGYYMFKMCGLF